MLMAILLLVALAQGAPAQPPMPPAPVTPTPPEAREIAPKTYLVPGAILPNRGPDGNTVVLEAPNGLVVIDTGRHPWHSEGILALARTRRAPITAIVNTHWHLDHSSGNGRVKAAYPAARVYTTTAVNQAIAPGGFLARNLAAATQAPPAADMPAVRREELDLFLATMAAADGLRPDVPIERSGPLTLAGRRLDVHVTNGAVSAADVWLFDAATNVAMLGDLVTLPAPFFESACPAQWQAELDAVWATPFTLAVPGHGAPMTRAQFDAYRQAFRGFRACVGSDRAATQCAAAWTRDVAAFLPSDGEKRAASDYGAYYVDFLRKSGGTSPDCAVK